MKHPTLRRKESVEVNFSKLWISVSNGGLCSCLSPTAENPHSFERLLADLIVSAPKHCSVENLIIGGPQLTN
jgi:hypothetical protein